MMNLKRCNSLLICFIIAVIGCHNRPKVEAVNEWKTYFEKYDVQGSFTLFDEKNNTYKVYNEKQFSQFFTPASTFKVCNSLIGLETGVINDENYTIQWDSIRRNEVWDADHDLKSAYKNSTVWYYQELARRVGGEKMKYWLDRSQYGNMDTTGGIDKFWLTGGLRISPVRQIDFLQRLHNKKLPFSERSMNIVEKIMVEEQTKNYILRAKTGWGNEKDIDVGWYIGYVQTKDNVYYFANCIQIDSAKLSNIRSADNFAKARKEIVREILASKSIIR